MPDADGERDPFVPREGDDQPPREPPPEPVPDAGVGPPPKPARRYAIGIVWLGIIAGIAGVALFALALSGLQGGAAGASVSFGLPFALLIAGGILLAKSDDRRRRSWGMGLLFAVPASLIAAPVVGFVACLVVYNRSY